MRKSCSVFGFILMLSLTGCAIQSNYAAYEGEKVIAGDGGTKTIVDGVDIWEDGTPPRKFKVIGIITDKRPPSRIAQSSFHTSIAAKVKEVGGDAAVIAGQNEALRGMVGNAYTTGNVTSTGKSSANVNATTFNTATPVSQVTSKIWVIKFMPD